MDWNVVDRKRGPWSPEEDGVLRRLVRIHGPRNWSFIAKSIPGRSGKSCRLRWYNQLSPKVERRPFTLEEDQLIIRAHSQYGNKWAKIARLFPGRTDNNIKNHWNATLRKKHYCMADGFKQVDLPHKRSSTTHIGSVSGINLNVSGVCRSNMRGSSLLNNSKNHVFTTLSLSPPGSDPRVYKKEGTPVEVLGPEFLTMVRQMIREEVRNYISTVKRNKLD